jgi:hypothetical protein
MSVKKDLDIKKIEIETNPKAWFGIILMFLLLFILPINIIYYMNNPEDLNPSIAGITSDNSGRYITLPLVNFVFDTQLKDPSTISFTLGSALLFIAFIMIIIFFWDFRNRERKYVR